MRFATIALTSAALASMTACSSSSGGAASGGDAGPTGPHDQFDVNVAGALYDYDCAEQPQALNVEHRGMAVMRTYGCGWPATSPLVEIDVELASTTPITEQTYDLATVSPSTLRLDAGLTQGSSQSLFASWEYATPGVGSANQVPMPGATGRVVVHAYDPSTGKLHVSLENVVLPVDADVSDPGAAAAMTITSAEVVR